MLSVIWNSCCQLKLIAYISVALRRTVIFVIIVVVDVDVDVDVVVVYIFVVGASGAVVLH